MRQFSSNIYSTPQMASLKNQAQVDLLHLKASVSKAKKKLNVKLQKIKTQMQLFTKDCTFGNDSHKDVGDDQHLKTNISKKIKYRNQLSFSSTKHGKSLIKDKINHPTSESFDNKEDNDNQTSVYHSKKNHGRSYTEHIQLKKQKGQSSIQIRQEQQNKSNDKNDQKLQVLKLNIQNRNQCNGVNASRNKIVEPSLYQDQQEDINLRLKISKSEPVQYLRQRAFVGKIHHNRGNSYIQIDNGQNNDNSYNDYEKRPIKKGRFKNFNKVGKIIKNRIVSSDKFEQQCRYQEDTFQEDNQCLVLKNIQKIQQSVRQFEKQGVFQLNNIQVNKIQVHNLEMGNQSKDNGGQKSQNNNLKQVGKQAQGNQPWSISKIGQSSNKSNDVQKYSQTKIEAGHQLKQINELQLATRIHNEPQQIHYIMVKTLQQIKANYQ